ncbi:hypothetical protein Ancab_006023 [Ancistrocladus abbreviatus]
MQMCWWSALWRHSLLYPISKMKMKTISNKAYLVVAEYTGIDHCFSGEVLVLQFAMANSSGKVDWHREVSCTDVEMNFLKNYRLKLQKLHLRA